MADTLESLEIEVKHSASGAAKEVDALTEAVKGLSKALDPCITRMRNFSSAMAGVSSGSKVSASLSETVSAANKVKPAMDSAASGVKNLSKAASKSTGPMGNFLSSLKRIAFYRFVRTIIKELTEAFKEGLENAYEYSKVVGGELAPALDRIATASQQMKNQLGAALGELLISLEPLIVELIHLVTLLAQAFTWLFATMEGRSEYLVANEVATSWKKADKAAKEYKKTLLGFDVINRLNGPGSGSGNGNDYSTMFHYEPTGSLGEFKWQDFSPFFKPLDDWVDSTLDALYVLVDLLDRIFNGNYELNLGLNWNVESIPILEKVKQWLDSLVASSPYVLAVEWQIANPVPEFEAITVSIEELLADMRLAFEGACSRIGEVLTQLQTSFAEAFGRITVTVNEWVDAFGRAGERVKATTGAVREGIATNLERAKGHITTFVKQTWAAWSEWASRTAQAAQTTMNKIAESTKTKLQTAKENVTTFVRTTKEAIGAWAMGIATAAQKAFVNISENVYLGLQSAADNIVNFVNGTATSIFEWAKNSVKNFAEWANGVIDSVVSGLSTAWESFKSFMEATGQAISGWWQGNKQWVVPVAIGAAITIGAIALAPATGGASLGALAFAANGGTFPNNGSLLVAGEAGPEIVANLGNSTGVMNVDQMRSAIRDGMLEAILASNRDGKTELHVYLDSREIKYGQSRLSRAMGV